MSFDSADYARRLKWFHEARFGMFIHWGLYAIPARGEWVMYNERIPKEEYAPLAARFNPDHFNPDAWVALAQEAGMKYMVMTTRHHDGFCLFDSQASVGDFTSVKTAARRDFVREYVDACRRAGIRIGFYYSWLDWRFPGYFLGPEKDPDSFNAMVEQAHAQIRELMTEYGTIDLLWYDGHWIPGIAEDRVADLWRANEVNTMVRQLQPDIIINNRSGLEEDLDTPEQHVTASRSGRGWESCMTIGDSNGWGYIRHNPNRKSVTQLLQHLVHAASGEGNFLLNVGPRADGIVPEEDASRLREMGRWMRTNGESIYGSQRCAFDGGIIGTTTAKDHTAYLHVFRWPGEEACIAGVDNEVKSARLLATGQPCTITRASNGRVNIGGLPTDPPDPHDAVIALDLDGTPRAIPMGPL